MSDKEMLGIYIDENLKESVERLSKKLGLSTSMFVRRVLEFTVNTFDEHEKAKLDTKDAAAILLAEQFKAEIKREVVEEIKKSLTKEG